ncbi:MAG: histidine--tRNA ligase, partial [Gammaproteobacteria bacterium]|nr:histidine--tRNA ligase [Gammaproteobacteria bacterium]
AYFSAHQEQLDEESLRRLHTNPLRILDSKNPQLRGLIEQAPSLMAYLGDASRSHFDLLCTGLTALDIEFVVNPRLVRGLDYYTRTVFEWVTDQLGAQGTVCAGGRYDGLVEQLGGRATPAVGFAMGVERLILLLEQQPDTPQVSRPDVYLVMVGEAPQAAGMRLAETLRDQLPRLRLIYHCGGGSFKSQFKKADRSGARYALILGEEELARGVIGVKPLRDESEQQEVGLQQLAEHLRIRL